MSWTNALQKMTLTRSTPYMCTAITRIQTEPTLMTEEKRAPFHSPVYSFTTPEWPCLACRGVSGSLARGTCDLNPAASRQFPMVLRNTAGATCAQISSLDAVRAAMAACTMHRSRHASVLCGRPEPGVGMFHRPLLKAATHDRYIVSNIVSNLSICPMGGSPCDKSEEQVT